MHPAVIGSLVGNQLADPVVLVAELEAASGDGEVNVPPAQDSSRFGAELFADPHGALGCGIATLQLQVELHLHFVSPLLLIGQSLDPENHNLSLLKPPAIG
jgi:hypothetical protein